MTVQNADREAIRHGKITEKPLRERPSYPTWAVKLTMAITGLIFGLFVLGHMIGNLKIFMPLHADGSAPIDDYGRWLREIGEPEHPEVLTTREDYANAPEGTIVARGDYSPYVKRGPNAWTTEYRSLAYDEDMANTARQVLRKGWGK